MLFGLLGGVSWSDDTKISRNLVHHFILGKPSVRVSLRMVR